MPTKEISEGIEIYLNGEKIEKICDFPEILEKQENREALMGIKIAGATYPAQAWLALLGGCPKTNNWLKLHGGIMKRRIKK
jgi:hypothetical protein